MSLRLALYARPELLTDKSDTFGMAVFMMWNLWSVSFPLTLDMLLDLMGLNFICAHFMFDISFSSSHFVHATIGVKVVKSSI